ncbi:MAG: Lrp/AsnC family transcriptional regulator [Candidatus Heimdallarchaeaceae archaeon]
MFQLDKKDLEIILELKRNAKSSMGQLTKKLEIPKSSIYRRILKLEEKGIISGYTARINFNKIGKPIVSFILISVQLDTVKVTQREIALEIAKIPEVYEIHIITGEYDLLAKVRTTSIENLGDVVVNKIRNIKGVGKTLSNVSLESIIEEIYLNKV